MASRVDADQSRPTPCHVHVMFEELLQRDDLCLHLCITKQAALLQLHQSGVLPPALHCAVS